MSLKFAASQEIDSNFISAITYGVAFREREKTKESEGIT